MGWSSSVKGKMMPLFAALLAGKNKVGAVRKSIYRITFHFTFMGKAPLTGRAR